MVYFVVIDVHRVCHRQGASILWLHYGQVALPALLDERFWLTAGMLLAVLVMVLLLKWWFATVLVVVNRAGRR